MWKTVRRGEAKCVVVRRAEARFVMCDPHPNQRTGEAWRHLVLRRLAHVGKPRVLEGSAALHPLIRVHGKQLLAVLVLVGVMFLVVTFLW